MSNCPHCGAKLEGLGLYCWGCRRYVDDGERADTGSEPADMLPDTRSEDALGPIELTIPWNTLASDNLRKGLNHARYKAYKAARDATHALALKQVPLRPWHEAGPVRVALTFWLPDRRRRDPNNLTKMLCDALQGVAYSDDAQISALAWEAAGIDRDSARVEIEVRAVETEEQAVGFLQEVGDE